MLNSSSFPTLGLVAYVLDTQIPYVYTAEGWLEVQVKRIVILGNMLNRKCVILQLESSNDTNIGRIYKRDVFDLEMDSVVS